MKKIKDLSTASIELILAHLENNDEFDCKLPGGGSLHIESGLPYLIICRTKNKDTGTKEFVMSEACYLIIGRKDFKGYQELIFSLAVIFPPSTNPICCLNFSPRKKAIAPSPSKAQQQSSPEPLRSWKMAFVRSIK